jgi:hypothetical protein
VRADRDVALRVRERGRPIVAIEKSDVERDLRPIARRYLGPEGGDAYLAETQGEHDDNVLVRMRPERWLAVDYSKDE